MVYPLAVAGKTPSAFSRRLLIASVVFGVFVVADLLLFGWLIFRSLSQLEIDRVLLEAKAEAKDLAGRIESKAGELDTLSGDFYLFIAKQREILRYIDNDLAQREEIVDVQIFDRDGVLVYQSPSDRRDGPATDKPLITEPRPGDIPTLPVDPPAVEPNLDVAERIGQLGTLRIGISPARVQERAAVLRRNLLRQTLGILVVSLAVLASAYAIILLLLRRARRLEDHAREADRMAYIGTLAAGLAHEIRNPLNSLNLNMQMLEEGLHEDGSEATNQRLLGITRQEISRLERLVTDFLLYAKPRPPEVVELSPVSLLTRVQEVLAGEVLARGARLKIEDSSGGALVKADAGQLTQLLLNLAQNAFNATEERPNGRPEIVLAARLSGDRLALLVEDNGIGIPAEEQRKIFELFYSTRKGGTGLGLAVVDRIARSHGGEIILRSTAGVGTSIGLALPVSGFARPPMTEALPTRDTGTFRVP